MTHMLKERKGAKIVTMCGAHAKWATIWHKDVDCPYCLTLMMLRG